MATIVDSVPDPWEPFKDKRLWQLSDLEMNDKPSFRAHQNTVTMVFEGLKQVMWTADGWYFVRFVDAKCQHSIDELAKNGTTPHID